MVLRRLVAAIDGGPIASAVIETAEALVPVLADRVDLVTVEPDVGATADRPGAPGHEITALQGADVGEAVVSETASGDVAAIVVGLRSVVGGPRPAGHVPMWIITHCETPVVVVPPQLDRSVDPLSAILLPLEGDVGPSPETAALVADLERRGSVVDAVHVFDRASTPLFWDRWQDPDLFAEQFSQQFSPAHGPTELRVGDVAGQILAAAEAHGSSLIVLEWKRRLDESHAAVVRDLLCNSPIRLMLVPVPESRDRQAGGRQRADTET